MSWRWIAASWLAMLWLSACGDSAPAPSSALAEQPQSLTVFAAASLVETVEQAREVFAADHPGLRVVNNFASSFQLAEQLAQGAPADVFASANREQMLAAVDAGRVELSQVSAFASNRLVIVVCATCPQRSSHYQDLAQPGLKLVLAAPAAPVGAYSLAFLEKAARQPGQDPAFEQQVLDNVVSYEETVRAVLTKVILGEADAGIVYASDLQGASAEQVDVVDIPADLNVEAVYYIAPIKDSLNPGLAGEYVAFMLSPQGQAILAVHRFLPPP
ncbi:MAG: molybdate ABC transporter substrate-binding protein [Anaerolineales bacterium]|nr:molybdate ABC transporter substrate-binding protein [Anaerolineales bacterium]